MNDRPLVVISNRGPVGLRWEGQTWHSSPAGGGLASMLTPLAREAGLTWMCCVGEPAEARQSPVPLDVIAAEANGPIRVVPITIPEQMYDAYYNSVSNEILWMLQHQLLGAGEMPGVDSAHLRAWERGYQAVNRQIADAAASICPEAKAFLVQDYHLYLVPDLLRRARAGVPILHFTHIPFAAPATWHSLPKLWPAAILKGMLGADVVGFQTTRDVGAFLRCCHDFLGLRTEERTADGRSAGTVLMSTGRRVVVRSYPASVDPTSLVEEMRSSALRAARERLTEHVGHRLIVRADRLDPAKNQLAGFKAFERLLETRPDLRGQVRFLAVLSPSRTDLTTYQAYRAAVLGAVGDVNERFAEACGGPPIILYLENDRPLALAALELCDVLLANSLADGMNLVPKEWSIVTQRSGAAVISETAGVADEASGTSLLVSPRDVERTAMALGAALDMPEAERARRLASFRERVMAWTSRDWLSAQLRDLERLGLPAATAPNPLPAREGSWVAPGSGRVVASVA